MTNLLALSQSDIADTIVDQRHPIARLARLLDRDSILPLGGDADSGVATVRGRINGSEVVAFCTDATVMGGALSAVGSQLIVLAIDAALRARCPIIGLWHSGGARLADGVESLDGVGQTFAAMTRASGRIPQISVVVGPAAGAAAYGPALTDIVIMSRTGRMFVTGPDVVRKATGEQIDMDSLGGTDAHGKKSGVVHLAADSEDDAYARARRITTLLAVQGRFDVATLPEGKDLRALLPDSPRRAYDVRPLVRQMLDADEHREGFQEFQPRWATNIVIGLGRLAGRTVGVVANNPLFKGGCLDSLSAEKAARFVRMCDAFGVPLVVVMDVPGYLPGVEQEWGGVVRRGAKLLHAFAEAVVPRVTLLTRKSYGGAYVAMNSRSIGATAVFAWPEAEVAVMHADAAVGVLHRRELAAAPPDERDALHADLVTEHRRITGGLARAVSIGVIDDVIEPADTRRTIAAALAAAPARRGRHSNIPL